MERTFLEQLQYDLDTLKVEELRAEHSFKALKESGERKREHLDRLTELANRNIIKTTRVSNFAQHVQDAFHYEDTVTTCSGSYQPIRTRTTTCSG